MKFQFAHELVLKTGRWLRDAVRNHAIDLQNKTSHQDIVTEYDKSTEEKITAAIHGLFPDDVVIGEETWQGAAAAGNGVWYLDPIDGTSNFVSQRMNYAISLGYYENGQATFGLVYDVAADVMYHAMAGQGAFRNGLQIHTAAERTELQDMLIYSPIVLETFHSEQPYGAAMQALAEQSRAVRSLGSLAIELCLLAEGCADIVASSRSMPWDYNAARVILNEAGGVLCNMSGEAIAPDYSGPILALSAKSLQDRLMEQYFKTKC